MMKYLIIALLLVNLCIWIAILQIPDNNVHIIACDVGQGDAILTTYKNFQVLTDGGPDNRVVDCLSKYMPFWDRTVELVILTHPQTDHFTGLIEIFRRYNVKFFLANSVDSSTSSYQVLKSQVGGRKVKVINPKVGLRFRYGLIYLDVVHPDDPNKESLGAFASKDDLNVFSILAKINFGNFSCLTTGDIDPKTIGEIISYSGFTHSDCLKVPHHGSKNGLTKEMLDIVDPKVALISVGAKNRYGHPSPEILDMLKDKGVKILRTDVDHDIEVISDGIKWWVKP
jgi:competence protein ComEC